MNNGQFTDILRESERDLTNFTHATRTEESAPLATLEQGTTHWLARILVPGQDPHYFVPDPHAYIVTKGDLVRTINKACPGVVYVSEETFNAHVARENEQPQEEEADATH